MEYDVNFPNGMEALGGACACRLLRLAPESTAFILQNAENGSERLLLGDVRRIGPEALPVLSAEELAALGADEKSNPAYYVVERERYAELQKKIESSLTESERRVWFPFIAGHTASEIAEMLGKDKRSVENAIYRARKKLRAAFPNPQ